MPTIPRTPAARPSSASRTRRWRAGEKCRRGGSSARTTFERWGGLRLAGIVVNRLGRTRDARYWYEQLAEAHGDLVIDPPVRLRAAVAEASAASLPLHALDRDGTAAAVAEMDAVLAAVTGRPAAESMTAEPVIAEPVIDLAGAPLVRVATGLALSTHGAEG